MDAQAQTTNPYLRTKVMTAGPMELRLMLYDGAIKFCRQARHALVQRDYERSYNGLMRAQKIVLELSNSLRPDTAPELCERMAALYNYLYRRLVDANMERDPSIVDECLSLIDYERETWRMVMNRVAEDPAADAASAASPSPADGTTPSAPPAAVGNPLASIGPAADYNQSSGFSVEG